MTVIISALIITLILVVLFVFTLFKANVYFAITHKYDLPYSFVIENMDCDSKKNVVLYGYNKHLLTANFGSDTAVRVDSAQPNVNYIEHLSQSSSRPFITRTISIKGKINDIKDLIFTLNTTDANGTSHITPVPIKNHLSTNKNKDIDLNDNESEQFVYIDYKFAVDGNSQIMFGIKPKAKLDVNIYYNTVQYRLMTVFNYLKALLTGTLHKKSSKIMPISICELK